MKKILLIAGILFAFGFTSCDTPTTPAPENPVETPTTPDNGNTEGSGSTEDSGSTEGSESTQKQSVVAIAPWGVLTTKTVLNSYADEPDAKIVFTYMPNESVNYDCPFLYTATDKSNAYGTSKELDSFKLKEFTAKTLATVEYKVADLITAMGDAEYLTFDAWGKVDYVQSIIISVE